MNASASQAASSDSAAGPCFRLIYRSHSALPDGDQGRKALAEILHSARINNARQHITGALVFYGEKDLFAQVLEGPEEAVRDLFDRIKSDSRHSRVDLREADAAPDRLFRKWAMALVAEHHEPDTPVIAAHGELAEAEPWRVTDEQEQVLTVLRDITRGYGKSY